MVDTLERIESPGQNGAKARAAHTSPAGDWQPDARFDDVPAPDALASLDLGDRPLVLHPPIESTAKRWTFALLALGVSAMFWVALHAYWAPAHPGIDQNGYLHGGRLFSETLSTGFKPPNPFHYVGGMWVMTEDGWVYPKYPLGVPVLVAIAMWVGGEAHGPTLAHLVAPVCATLAVLAIFFLARAVAGSFAGLLAQLLLATNPILWAMTNNPWSHAPSLAFATAGMLLLLAWWRDERTGWKTTATGIAAGFLLGYALTVRYTDGLLLLPMALAMVCRLRWRNPKSYLRCAAPLAGWLAPVAYLLAFNKLAMGTWTGYDTTNESTGFNLAEVADKWPIMMNLLYGTGLYFVFPIGVLGLLLLPRWNWRVGTLLLLWLVPGLIVYTSYYWGENAGGMGYGRFFLSLLPPVLIGAAWAMVSAARATTLRDTGDQPVAHRGVLAPLAVGVVVAIACAANVRMALPTVERSAAVAANLADTTSVLLLHTRNTPRSDIILFAEGSGGGGPVSNYLNHLQFATGFELYAANAFTTLGQAFLRAPPRGAGGEGADAPSPIQPRRREYLRAEYAKYSDDDLIKQQNELMRSALAKGRRVLALLPAAEADRFERRYVGENFGVKTLAAWREPVKWQEASTAVGGNAQDRRGATRRPAGGGPQGAPGFAPGAPQEPRGPWNQGPLQQSMRLIEIVRK